MICPRCHSQVADGIKFCGVCGAPLSTSSPQQGVPASPQGAYNAPPPPQGPYAGTPPPQGAYGAMPPQGTPPPQGVYNPPNEYEQYENSTFGNPVPKVELHNPQGPLRIADMTITIDGQLVPVVDIMLGNQMPIYFEHHILLWKHPGVQLGFKQMRGLARRVFAGIQIFVTEAQGPGNISFSRDSVGQIVALRLQPGQMVEVREHQFLVATGNVDYNYTFSQGAANILFSRSGLFIDQFTAQGGEGMLLLHGYGNVFEKVLAPGEALDIEPGAWLWKDPSVQMQVTTVANSQRGGGGIFGAISNFVAGASIIMNRFIGPGRVGIQSMTYHPPQPEGAQQAGGQNNMNVDLNNLF